MTLHTPKTEQELSRLLAEEAGPFAIEGSGSKQGFGRPVETSSKISLKGFSGITVYEPEELILEARAATPLAAIAKQLRAKNQMLAFEPPDLGHLWDAKGQGTLGGLASTGLSGPRRIRAGSLRDHILGFTAVSGRGEIFKAGARVVKNVTGYDLPKLMAGSFGTFAALTSITMKVLPAPETEETVFVPGVTSLAGVALLSKALQSSAEVAAAAHVPGEGAYIRLEGIDVSVRARREKLVKLLAQRCEILDAKASAAKWVLIRDCRVFSHEPARALWRISVAPSEGPATVQRIAQHTDCRHYFDWGGGLVWLDVPAGEDAQAGLVRQCINAGHATLYKAPEGVRARVAVFHPQDAAISALSARVKAAFDPDGKLNPGRMKEGL